MHPSLGERQGDREEVRDKPKQDSALSAEPNAGLDARL